MTSDEVNSITRKKSVIFEERERETEKKRRENFELNLRRHISCSSGLAKTIMLQGTVKGVRRQGRQKKKKGGQTTSGNGQAWSSPSPRGQCRMEKNGGNW